MFLQKGFSLLEVGVALLILGLAVTSIFQFISSTTLSAFDLEDRAYARQIANNRLALVQTLEPMIGTNERDGQIDLYPIPDGDYVIRFDLVIPEQELTTDTDTTAMQKNVITSLAWAKAIEERGEDGGISVSSQYAVAKQALADAIAIEAARRPDEETVWYPS